MQRRRVIVIGGGAIGLSVAYHLGRLGVDEVLLLERGQLTSGTSWHAAGIVGPLRASMNLTRLAKYAIELFAELEDESGQATGYRQTGGVWLAQDAARVDELRRIKAMGDRSGLDCEMLGAAEIGARLPFIACDDLAGGLWVEQDGQVDPVGLCMAYARAARALGIEIREHARVAAIETESGAVSGVTLADGGRIGCDSLVLCAGAWSRRLAATAGAELPLAACEHMYIVTDVIQSIPRPCPIVRDLDSGIYLKGDAGKLVLGAFEADPKPWTPAADDPGFLMFDEDWDHAQPMLNAGIRRAPLIADAGITHFMNGPESFTPDTRQLMGETPGCTNLFVAAGFNSIGIMSSAGVGRVIADWVRDGQAPMDLWEVDVCRMDPLQNDEAWLAQRLPEAVHNQFARHWPYKQYRTGRNLRRSPWHHRLAARGAVFGAPGGWERPLWYATGDDPAEFEYGFGAQCWWPAARREAQHCQQQVSLFELSPFSKFDLGGRGAANFLQRLCCGDMDIEPGRVRYSLMLNRRGGIEAEISVTRLDQSRFRIVGGAATRFKDLHWMRRQLGPSDEVEIVDVTGDYAVLGVMGPKARELICRICETDFSDAGFAFSSAQTIFIGSVEILALRLSFVGELGWELYVPAARATEVFDRVVEAGSSLDLGFAGHFALDSCRLEMGYHHWGHDIGPDDTPFECGLGFAVALDKAADFNGREALLEQQRNGWNKQLCLCAVDATEVLILHDEPVYRGAAIVGHCTSGGPGFRTGSVLCFVMFYRRESRLDRLQIEIGGERFDLTVLERAPWRRAE